MKPKLILLLIVFVIQLAVPAYMIFEQHKILTEGTAYKFKTRPIDPYDPFRGRYVTLSYTANQEPIPVLGDAKIESDDWVYALINTDEEGFAVLSGITDKEPESGQGYLYLKTYWGSQEQGYHLVLPFNRYYASEEKAPQIESAVWRRQRSEVENVYALIRVLNGKASIEELMVEGQPVHQYLIENQ